MFNFFKRKKKEQENLEKKEQIVEKVEEVIGEVSQEENDNSD